MSVGEAAPSGGQDRYCDPTQSSRRKPKIRPAATAATSRFSGPHVTRDEVGEIDASSPSSLAIADKRRLCDGSDTKTTVSTPTGTITRFAAARDS